IRGVAHLQALIWIRLLAAALGGAALGIAAVVRRTVMALKKDWVLVDGLTDETLDPHDESGPVWDLPLGDQRVQVRFRGQWQAAWEKLGPERQRNLINLQGAAAWSGLILLILALLPAGARAGLPASLAVAGVGFIIALLLHRAGLWTLGGQVQGGRERMP